MLFLPSLGFDAGGRLLKALLSVARKCGVAKETKLRRVDVKRSLLSGPIAVVLAFAATPNVHADSVDGFSPGDATLERIADYRVVGEISFKKFFFHIYDAQLRVEGSVFSWERPYALTLTYARKISNEALVDASLSEMSRISGEDEARLERFREPLTACFSDVDEGDRITGLSLGADKALFFYNGEQTCSLEMAGASEMFFSIWLGENTQSPKKSRRLRGLSS